MSELGIAAGSVAFGVACCFWGYRLFHIALAVQGFIVGAALLSGEGVSGMVVGGFIGAVAGIVFYYIGVWFVGAFMGGGLGLVIGLAVGGLLSGLGLSSTFGIVIAGLFALFGGVAGGSLAVAMLKPTIILGTAISGALIILLGLGLLIGAVENELSLDLVRGLPFPVIVVWAMLALAGLIVQFLGVRGVQREFRLMRGDVAERLKQAQQEGSEGGTAIKPSERFGAIFGALGARVRAISAIVSKQLAEEAEKAKAKKQESVSVATQPPSPVTKGIGGESPIADESGIEAASAETA